MGALKFFSPSPSSTSSLSERDLRVLLDSLPIAVMTCDMKSFEIDYANARSVELLGALKHILPIDPDHIVGTCIDIFHKDPSHQRKMLADPSNLPHSAIINLDTEYLDLYITAYHDRAGNYTKAILSWSIVTDKVKADRETKRLMQMIDKMPLNVMTCDINDEFKMDYMNQTSRDTLKQIEEHLPTSVDAMIGQSIDIFHKDPSHQRRMLADPSNLPHEANIRVGPEVLKLKVSAIEDEDGSYMGPMLSWSIITDIVSMAEDVTGAVDGLTATSNEMSSSAEEMLGLASEANALAGSVSAASEEMTASIQEISRQLSQATSITTNAVNEAQEANNLVNTLSESAEQIGAFTEIIESLADKTNLLSLNATIEAARAGEAGKGFAVVANEVKALAKSTADATTQIKEQVEGIQGAIKTTVTSIRTVSETINEINDISAQISAAVEQQTATTAEVSQNIGGVSAASSQTGTAATKVQDIAGEVKNYSTTLGDGITDFLDKTT